MYLLGGRDEVEWTIYLSQENKGDRCFQPAEWKLESLSQPSSSRRLWLLLKGEEINKGDEQTCEQRDEQTTKKGLCEHQEMFILPGKWNAVAYELNKMFVCSVTVKSNSVPRKCGYICKCFV